VTAAAVRRARLACGVSSR